MDPFPTWNDNEIDAAWVSHWLNLECTRCAVAPGAAVKGMSGARLTRMLIEPGNLGIVVKER